MSELLLNEPVLVGRESESLRLEKALEETLQGSGHTIFVSGEAGVGKTRLVEEFLSEAEKKGVLVVRGGCLAESLEPLMPFKEALRAGGLQHLISGAPPPRVVSAYLFNDAGLVMAKAERREVGPDPDIFASMLTAVGTFAKDTMAKFGECSVGNMNVIGFDKYRIVIQSMGKLLVCAILEGVENEFLLDDMQKTLKELGTTFDNWSGKVDEVASAVPKIRWFVESGKYDGRFLVDDPRLRQENLFDNILMGLQRASCQNPVLLFLDDLQWVDPTTLLLLHYLSRNTRNSRILIVGTYRPEDIVQSWDGKVHHLETAMQNMGRENLLEKMKLRRLGPEETAQMVSSALGKNTLDAALFKKIHMETEGNPFFIVEVVELLLEEDVLVKDKDGTWRSEKDTKAIDIPSKVYDVVKRRLDKLMKEQREILECASVIGEEFSTDLLEKTTEMRRLSLLKNLGEIEKNHRLIQYISDKYHFDHAKIREVLYNNIAEELRKEYHKITADTLLEININNTNDIVSQLAYHYNIAGDAKAKEYLLKAGDLAKEAYANEEAIRFYENAIEILQGRDRLDALEKMGDINALTGEWARAIEIYTVVEESAEDIETRARIHRKTAQVYHDKSQYDLCIGTAKGGAKLLGCDRTTEKGRLLYVQGFGHYRKGECESAHSFFMKAKEIFEDLEEESSDMGNVLRAIGNIHLDKGKYEYALDYYRKSQGIMEKVGDQGGMAAAFNNIGVLAHKKGECDNAIENFLRALDIWTNMGRKWGIANIFESIGDVKFDEEDIDGAKEYYDKCLSICREMGDKIVLVHAMCSLARIDLMRGGIESAIDKTEEVFRIAVDIGTNTELGVCHRVLSLIYSETGDLEKATDEIKKSESLYQERGAKDEVPIVFYEHALLLKKMGRSEEAKQLLEQALESFTSMGMRLWAEKCRRALEEG